MVSSLWILWGNGFARFVSGCWITMRRREGVAGCNRSFPEVLSLEMPDSVQMIYIRRSNCKCSLSRQDLQMSGEHR